MLPSLQTAGRVSPSVMLITAIFIILGVFASGLVATCEPFLVLGLMLLIGLPHGATDHGLFLALHKEDGQKRKINFYLTYLGIIALYGAVWFMLPTAAFIIFMLLSVYHFGQSNWVDLAYKSKRIASAHYLLWGAGILLTPILLHADEAIAIVATMTGTTLSAPSREVVMILISSAAAANASVILYLMASGMLSKGRALLELVAYVLLLGVFFTNSLLLGFTIYFVFWHSLTSAHDQLLFFKRRLSPGLRKQLMGEIAMTVLGALVFCLIVWFGPGPEAALQPKIIGGVFITISLLTMPHMILVEQLYSGWSPVKDNKRKSNANNANKQIKSNHITARSNASPFVNEGPAFTH